MIFIRCELILAEVEKINYKLNHVNPLTLCIKLL